MGNNLIKYCYIFGHGHSGSTLLDIMLSVQPGVESVGEIVNIGRYLTDNKECTCKSKINSCGYWNSVIAKTTEILEKHGVEDYDFNFSDKLKPGLFSKMKYILSRFFKLKLNEGWERYIQGNYQLFSTILGLTNKEMIVDSSKSPLRLLVLANSGMFDIKVIHLYRDLRALIESDKRKSKEPGREVSEYSGPARKMFQLWKSTLHQKLVLRNIPENRLLGIAYEKMAKEPEIVLQKICKFLDIPYNEKTFQGMENGLFAGVIHHNIGGNRLRMKPIKKIEYQCRWPNGLSKYEKILFQLLGGQVLNFIQSPYDKVYLK